MGKWDGAAAVQEQERLRAGFLRTEEATGIISGQKEENHEHIMKADREVRSREEPRRKDMEPTGRNVAGLASTPGSMAQGVEEPGQASILPYRQLLPISRVHSLLLKEAFTFVTLAPSTAGAKTLL